MKDEVQKKRALGGSSWNSHRLKHLFIPFFLIICVDLRPSGAQNFNTLLLAGSCLGRTAKGGRTRMRLAFPPSVRLFFGAMFPPHLLFIALSVLFVRDAIAERADTLGIDGVYRGTIGMQLSNKKGKEYNAPAKFVFMPDGKGALLTAQHPDGVLTVVMRGELRGPVFVATSEGRLDYGGYHQGMKWDISFDRKAGTATLHGKVVNLPKWAHDDDLRYTFKKEQKR